MALVTTGAGWYTTWLRAHYYEQKRPVSECMNEMPVREQTKKSRNGDPPCRDCMRRLFPGRMNGTAGHP